MYVDFYHASQGPRILFLLRSTDDRAWLQGLLRDLASRRVSMFGLQQVERTEFSKNGPPILLKLVENEGSRQIQYEKTGSDGKVLVWSRHAEGWLECAQKIAALAAPGHQFMGNGEAEIAVSFLENLKKT
jgi:hypothetical protein